MSSNAWKDQPNLGNGETLRPRDLHIYGWDPKEQIPNPGSLEAIDLGCTCPRMDNANGLGLSFDGKREWWRSADCPLHYSTEDNV